MNKDETSPCSCGCQHEDTAQTPIKNAIEDTVEYLKSYVDCEIAKLHMDILTELKELLDIEDFKE